MDLEGAIGLPVIFIPHFAFDDLFFTLCGNFDSVWTDFSSIIELPACLFTGVLSIFLV